MKEKNKLAKQKIFISGGAGFIGSNLVERLVQSGCFVTAYDNLSLGKKEFIEAHLDNPNFKFVQKGLLNFAILKKYMTGHDIVFHMAANSDISSGVNFTDVDLKQGVLATYNVLECMRLNKIKRIIFGSTSAVYAEAKKMPTSEDYGPLLPISFYGASKLGCEGYITAFVHNFGMQAWIYRFANVVGKNATHGVIYDFIKKLRKTPRCLQILGDGKQRKPYIFVDDCLKGMFFGYRYANEAVNCFNLAGRGTTDVDTIARIVVQEMGLKNVEFVYTGQNRGWQGDVPQVRLDATKIKKLGWKPKYTSEQAVKLATKILIKQIKV